MTASFLENPKRIPLLSLALGVAAWLAELVAMLANPGVLTQIDALILLGVTVVAPLSLFITLDTTYSIDNYAARTAVAFQPFCIAAVTVSFFAAPGTLSGVLSLAWLTQTGLFALMALAVILGEDETPALDELCVHAGYAFSAVSGVWLAAYRFDVPFFGFEGVLIPLTAAHFAFIGPGALVLAGQIGSAIREHNPVGMEWFRPAALGAIVSPGVVAAGITLTNESGQLSQVEVAGVILLSVSFVALSILYIAYVHGKLAGGASRWLLLASSVTLFATMGLALGYSVSRITGAFALTIPTMVQWHGWLNAFGFVVLGMVGWMLRYLPASD